MYKKFEKLKKIIGDGNDCSKEVLFEIPDLISELGNDISKRLFSFNINNTNFIKGIINYFYRLENSKIYSIFNIDKLNEEKKKYESRKLTARNQKLLIYFHCGAVLSIVNISIMEYLIKQKKKVLSNESIFCPY